MRRFIRELPSGHSQKLSMSLGGEKAWDEQHIVWPETAYQSPRDFPGG